MSYIAPIGIGPALQFAHWYVVRTVNPNRKVLIIPVARGGTPFEGVSFPPGFSWKVGREDVTSIYPNMIRRTLAAKAAADASPGTKNTFAGMLGTRGESDGDNGTTGTTYSDDLDALISATRTDLSAPSMPIVIGTMVPEYLGPGTRKAIDAVHRSTPLRFPKTDVDVGAVNMNKGDANHYSEAGQRFNGRAFYAAYERITHGIARVFTDYKLATPLAPSLSEETSTSLKVSWASSRNAASYYRAVPPRRKQLV
jgi:hypothetical protein